MDDESGLAYNRFRYYDPSSGTYLTSDPIGLLGGETPYAYVHNPMGWVDPFGLASCRAKRLGDFGEKKAKEMLEKSGKYKTVFPVQNKSGHGIDLVGLRKDGKFDIFEVKTNSTGIAGDLSKRQESSSGFITDILINRKAGSGNFGIPAKLAREISKNIGDTQKLDVFVKTGAKNRWYVDEILTSKW